MEVAVTGAVNRTARRGAQRAAFQRARVAKRRASQEAAGEAPSAQAELSSATLVLQRPDAGAALGVAPTDGQPPKSAVRGHVLPLPPPKRSLRFPAAGLAPIDPMPSGINKLDAEATDVWESRASGITTVAVPGDRAPGSVAGTALHTACSGADSVVTPCHHHHLLGRPVHQPTRPLVALDETPCAQRSASDLAATVKVTAERTPSPVLRRPPAHVPQVVPPQPPLPCQAPPSPALQRSRAIKASVNASLPPPRRCQAPPPQPPLPEESRHQSNDDPFVLFT